MKFNLLELKTKMPNYSYNCSNCHSNFDYFHSISEKKEECEVCKTKTLSKIPVLNTNVKVKIEDKPIKAGSLVESAIAEGKQELEKHKKELREKEFK